MELDIFEVCKAYGFKIADKNGLHPTPAGKLKTGKWELLALDLTAEAVMDKGINMCRDAAVTEFFISFDCLNLPSRAEKYHSVLVILHVRKGRESRLGSMEYGWEEGQNCPLIKDPIWNDAFWSRHYIGAMNRLVEESGKPPVFDSAANQEAVGLLN